VERILIALGYDDETPAALVMQRVGAAWLFAIETGMRQGEIAGLLETDVDLHRSVAHLRQTKNGQERTVPLSPRAMDILRRVRTVTKPDPRWFGMNVSQVTPLFIKARKAAMIENLTFHDARHAAITRLAKKLDVLSLARMVGHRDIRQLMVYYNPDAEELAKRLR
jgi:integrase